MDQSVAASAMEYDEYRVFHDDSKMEEARRKVVNLLKTLGQEAHSFRLIQMSSMATGDPFGKIRGLIQDMISKLQREAEEEATQKGFCDEEMGKSKDSQEKK